MSNTGINGLEHAHTYNEITHPQFRQQARRQVQTHWQDQGARRKKQAHSTEYIETDQIMWYQEPGRKWGVHVHVTKNNASAMLRSNLRSYVLAYNPTF